AELRAEIHRAVPGRGDRGRGGQFQGLVRRGHGARHHRYAGALLPARRCALPALCRGVLPPPVAAQGALAADVGRMKPALDLKLGWHALPWVIAIAFYFLAGGYLSLGTQVMIWVLFTLSLDLVLGYAGIVTLGHAAFFGFGAYAAGIFA